MIVYSGKKKKEKKNSLGLREEFALAYNFRRVIAHHIGEGVAAGATGKPCRQDTG